MSDDTFPHSWEDVSYHGSPTWVCEFCGVEKWRWNRKESPEYQSFCPKAKDALIQKKNVNWKRNLPSIPA